MDRERLEQLYVEERKGYKEIAETLGVSESSLYRWLKKYKLIGTRSRNSLEGQRFGKLEVLKHVRTGRYPKGGVYDVWKCRCDCGKTISVRGGNLKQGQKTCKQCASSLLSDKLRECPIDYKLWNRITERCKNRGIELSVTPDYLAKLFEQQNGKCAITGVPLFMAVRRRDKSTASPDRIDPSKGYVKGNVRWLHKTVNFMRNTMTDEELVYWCKLVLKGNSFL